VNYGVLIKLQRKILWRATGLAVGLHMLLILSVILLTGSSAESQYKPLATMDFAHYDPEGGEPGKVEEPKPKPKPAPEPVEIPAIVSSTSKIAVPAPLPPVKKIKPKPKPQPQPKPEPQQEKNEEVKVVSEPGSGQGEAAKSSREPELSQTGTGRGGVGGGTGQGNPKAFNAYISKIGAKLNRLKKYPPAMASRRIGGIVTVNFTVDRGGNVISSRMVASSGQTMLDEETIALLKRCSPFPAMPKELTETTINLTVPIQFKLLR